MSAADEAIRASKRDGIWRGMSDRPRSPKCFRPWCGVSGKFCIDCAPLQPKKREARRG